MLAIVSRFVRSRTSPPPPNASGEQATYALSLIEVEYDELPAVVRIEQALADDAPELFEEAPSATAVLTCKPGERKTLRPKIGVQITSLPVTPREVLSAMNKSDAVP
jgi:hypothetical protein